MLGPYVNKFLLGSIEQAATKVVDSVYQKLEEKADDFLLLGWEEVHIQDLYSCASFKNRLRSQFSDIASSKNGSSFIFSKGDVRPKSNTKVLFQGHQVYLTEYVCEVDRSTKWKIKAPRSLNIRKRLVALWEEHMQQKEKREGVVHVYDPSMEEWNEHGKFSRTPNEGLILPKGLLEKIKDDLHKFKSSEAEYNRLGIPYRRGYLFYGPPGTGKTSLIKEMAKIMGKDIWCITEASFGGSELNLSNALRGVQKGSLVVFEDLDTFNLSRTDKASKMGSVLGSLDGLLSVEGVVIVITTNVIDRLDAALVRPGRIDTIYELGYADEDQLVRMLRKFFPSDDFNVVDYKNNKTPADIQSACQLSGSALEALDRLGL